jgi:hypothetical protein
MTKLFLCIFTIFFQNLLSKVNGVCQVYDFINDFDTQHPAILLSDDLPYFLNGTLENKLLPYVGNGHLASTLFDKHVYLNGLYNGNRGESHRAGLPNIHNFFLNSPDSVFKDKQYALHLKNGEFI